MPEPKALTIKSAAETKRAIRRPKKSAIRPAMNAPAAQPSNIDETLKPLPTAVVPNDSWSALTVPLITPLSKPKRNQPRAAMDERRITFPSWGVPEGVMGMAGVRRAERLQAGRALRQPGRILHAWVLMGYRHHPCMETPPPKPVEGMTWLQTAIAHCFSPFRKESGYVSQGC